MPNADRRKARPTVVMRQVDFTAKLAELATERPEWVVFRRLGDLTKLRQAEGTFRAVNYESGALLYALVRRYAPRRILEIGTGRGYGALCMAMALEDGGLPGEIVTVDTRAYDEPQEWALDDGTGPRVERLSRRDVWERHIEQRWRRRVVQVQGSSFDALQGLGAKGEGGFALVYIDGDHTHPVVRHDFYGSLLLTRPPFRILLDDYTPLSHLYGVRRLVDEELAPVFDAEMIHTDGRWEAGPDAVPEADQAQVLLDSEKTTRPLEAAFPPARLRRIVARHRRWPRALARADAIRTAAAAWLGRR
jgi:methyltransferase family protein